MKEIKNGQLIKLASRKQNIYKGYFLEIYKNVYAK
jgi:hypothetical protein